MLHLLIASICCCHCCHYTPYEHYLTSLPHPLPLGTKFNATYRLPGDNFIIFNPALQVLRPIAQGEELVQSYIDESAPYLERVKALADYGFSCSCNKCQRGE